MIMQYRAVHRVLLEAYLFTAAAAATEAEKPPITTPLQLQIINHIAAKTITRH